MQTEGDEGTNVYLVPSSPCITVTAAAALWLLLLLHYVVPELQVALYCCVSFATCATCATAATWPTSTQDPTWPTWPTWSTWSTWSTERDAGVNKNVGGRGEGLEQLAVRERVDFLPGQLGFVRHDLPPMVREPKHVGPQANGERYAMPTAVHPSGMSLAYRHTYLKLVLEYNRVHLDCQ